MIKRPYQEEAIEAVRVAYKADIHNQLLVMATGTGKTFTATDILKNFDRCLWMTHTEELIDQSARAICSNLLYGENMPVSAEAIKDDKFNYLEFLNGSNLFVNKLTHSGARMAKQNVGIIKRERIDLDCRVSVASIQTLWRRLDKIDPNHFDIVIVDEAHQAAAKTWSRCLNHFNSKLRLGLTATPKRTDGMSLGNIFDQITYEYNIDRGIFEGYLCELNAKQIQTELTLDNVRTTAGELNQKDLRIIDCPERNELIVDKYEEYALGRPTLTFCVDVEHAINLARTFTDRGYNSSFVVGDEKLCPDRKRRISAFKSGEIEIMSSVMVLTMGFDYPGLACGILACPTKSLTKYMQQIGRLTRLKEDYNDAIILDIVDVTSKHKLINTWTLDGSKPIEKKIFMTGKQKGEAIAREKAELEEKLSKIDKGIDLFAVPELKQNFTSTTMRMPATDKQLAWIKSLGHDIENTTFTKGMASEVISNVPATSKQVYALKMKGYQVDGSLTRAEAEACFNEDKSKDPKASIMVPKAGITKDDLDLTKHPNDLPF